MAANDFARRHTGIDPEAEGRMLAAVGYDTLEQLMAAAVPADIRGTPGGTDPLPPAATETEALHELRMIAGANTVRHSMIGQGYYGTVTPAVIRRNVVENPSWYTAYTPYQPEISQGRLEALITFQTMVADLTGLATANASMLDEATAVAEGMLLARRASKVRGRRFLLDADALEQTKLVVRTRAEAVGIELVEVRAAELAALDADAIGERFADCFGVFLQYPGASGRVWDPTSVVVAAHEAGALAVVAADLLALTLVKTPGDFGADIAAGTSQRFGVPMGFGGPHAGYLAVRAGLERQLPGRLVGVSKDADGHPAYRLTLQTREQHIRREKATSNICTAQVLLAVMAAMYAVYHGPDGLRRVAQGVATTAKAFADRLATAGFELEHTDFVDTIVVKVPSRAHDIVLSARERGILLREIDADSVGLSFDETVAVMDGEPSDRTGRLLDELAAAFGLDPAATEPSTTAIPPDLLRTSDYLTHPVFSAHRSETAMMRYLKRLADKDYALDTGMIPLGSCTMKLNAAAEMEAVTWPAFANLHPSAPAEDTAGYRMLIAQLEGWLASLTGYDRVSLQPNAGSQGELAGLLAIRRYHLSRGQDARTVCLIPQSAHGTNAASAVLAGLSVTVVACDENGNVDLDDLRAKIADSGDTLAALMITYPSTHGVYESTIREITLAVHRAGGQVYIDGANLNALIGQAGFAELGGDVSHLNLHKTFCIPHGGGGPGVGPVAAREHLAPFLPEFLGDGAAVDAAHAGAETQAARPRIAAAAFGSPSILPISWAYVRMMGSAGLAAATETAVLAANYVAARLRDHFPVLYTGQGGLVAHECILDVRPLTAATGITVDDVAKRLIDYGFHAPTMSFPVPGTLMVEPTESEDIAELDRFIAAMIAIKAEADAVAAGAWPADDNPLVAAPHTAASVIAAEWDHPYSREQAVYPMPALKEAKYWPPVRRVDQAWGDRNLFCACPPPEAFT